MGKCVSKNQQLHIREIDERAYVAISDEFDYYRYENEVRIFNEFVSLKWNLVEMAL